MIDFLDQAPVRRRRLYEEIEERIVTEIRAGRLKAGDSLPSERDLMRRFVVGRPAIRDALLSLEKKGLIQIGSGERSRVTRPTVEGMISQLSGAAMQMLLEPEGLEQMQGARTVLEGALSREAARLASPDAIKQLRAVLGANRAALDDPVAFERTDVEFHSRLVEAAGNPIFTAIHQGLVVWLLEQRMVSLRRPGAAQRALDFHERIFLAVARRDADGAEAAMREHLSDVAQAYRATAGEASTRASQRRSSRTMSSRDSGAAGET